MNGAWTNIWPRRRSCFPESSADFRWKSASRNISAKIDRMGHVGFHPQKQEGRVYVGLVLPVGRMTAAQMRGLAAIADRFGSGDLRLTVWQNLLITDLRAEDTETIKSEIEKLGLHWSATNVRAGLVACTGNAGCKFAAANTKAHALLIADHLESQDQYGSAGEYPFDRLSSLLRPALHRRYRIDRDHSRRRRRHDRGLSTSASAADMARGSRSPARCSATYWRPTAAPRRTHDPCVHGASRQSARGVSRLCPPAHSRTTSITLFQPNGERMTLIASALATTSTMMAAPATAAPFVPVLPDKRSVHAGRSDPG